jgi:hypothetical protein
MALAERALAHDGTSRLVNEGIVLLETGESQYHGNQRGLDEKELDSLTVVPSGVVGDSACRATIQRSNVNGNGEGLSGDVQLGRRVTFKKLLSAPDSTRTQRDLDWSPHSRMA